MNVASLNGTAIKYRKELILLPIIELEKTLAHMTLMPGVQHQMMLGQLEGSPELRPYKKAYTAQDVVKAVSRTLQVYKGQVVLEEDPEDLRAKVWGENLIGNTKPVTKHPIEAKIIALIVRQVAKNLGKAMFSGVRNDSGTKTAALFNGFDTITSTEKSAGNISAGNNNYLSVEAITSSNAVDIFKQIFRAASDELQGQASKIVCSFDLYNKYVDDYKAETGAAPYNREFDKTYLEGSQNMCEIVPLIGKKNSNFIHVTTKENLIVGVDQQSDKEVVKVREVDNPNVLQFVLNMMFGVQFGSISAENFFVAETPSSSGSN